MHTCRTVLSSEECPIIRTVDCMLVGGHAIRTPVSVKAVVCQSRVELDYLHDEFALSHVIRTYIHVRFTSVD